MNDPRRGFLVEEIAAQPQRAMKFTDYVKETRTEMTHVNWPSREQTIKYTLMVIIVALVTAILLGASDFVFSKLLTLLF